MPLPEVDFHTYFKLVGHRLHKFVASLSTLHSPATATIQPAASGTQKQRSAKEILREAKSQKRKLSTAGIELLQACTDSGPSSAATQGLKRVQPKVMLEAKMEDNRMRLDLLAYNGTVINMGHTVLVDADQDALDSSIAAATAHASAHSCQVWVISIYTSPETSFPQLLRVPKTGRDDQVHAAITCLSSPTTELACRAKQNYIELGYTPGQIEPNIWLIGSLHEKGSYSQVKIIRFILEISFRWKEHSCCADCSYEGCRAYAGPNRPSCCKIHTGLSSHSVQQQQLP